MGRDRGGDTKDTERTTTDNPPVINRYLGTGRGRKGGVNGRGTQLKKQARGEGCRDERQGLSVGGWGRSPGGRRTTPGEDVGSG